MKMFQTMVLLFVLTLLTQIGFTAPPAVSENIKPQNALLKTLMLKVSYEQGHYEIIDAWLVDGQFKLKKGNKNKDSILFDLKNKQKESLGSGSVQNPNILRGIFEEHSTSSPHDEQEIAGEFIVRFPYEEGMEILTLIPVKDLLNNVASGLQSAPVEPVELNFAYRL